MMQPTLQPWLCFSSSSGATFKAVHDALPQGARASLKGFLTDRPCGASQVARELLPEVPVVEFPRKEFEASALKWMQAAGFHQGHVLLCGFFGILTADFLAQCPAPISNTHPSLLPAFPGKDEAVHRKAFEEAAISGFSLHLVNEKLDGGPVFFQHPVILDVRLSGEDNRARVRQAEQTWLPRVWSRVLAQAWSPGDRHLSSRALREKYGLHFESFLDTESLR